MKLAVFFLVKPWENQTEKHKTQKQEDEVHVRPELELLNPSRRAAESSQEASRTKRKFGWQRLGKPKRNDAKHKKQQDEVHVRPEIELLNFNPLEKGSREQSRGITSLFGSTFQGPTCTVCTSLLSVVDTTQLVPSNACGPAALQS